MHSPFNLLPLFHHRHQPTEAAVVGQEYLEQAIVRQMERDAEHRAEQQRLRAEQQRRDAEQQKLMGLVISTQQQYGVRLQEHDTRFQEHDTRLQEHDTRVQEHNTRVSAVEAEVIAMKRNMKKLQQSKSAPIADIAKTFETAPDPPPQNLSMRFDEVSTDEVSTTLPEPREGEHNLLNGNSYIVVGRLGCLNGGTDSVTRAVRKFGGNVRSNLPTSKQLEKNPDIRCNCEYRCYLTV